MVVLFSDQSQCFFLMKLLCKLCSYESEKLTFGTMSVDWDTETFYTFISALKQAIFNK